MPPTRLASNVTPRTAKAKESAGVPGIPNALRAHTYVASRKPSPLIERDDRRERGEQDYFRKCLDGNAQLTGAQQESVRSLLLTEWEQRSWRGQRRRRRSTYGPGGCPDKR